LARPGPLSRIPHPYGVCGFVRPYSSAPLRGGGHFEVVRPGAILLVSASWPQRALVRAQLVADTDRDVVGADSAASAIQRLGAASFALVVLDTQGLSPDPRLVDALCAQRTPLVLVTGPFDQARWAAAVARLEVRATLVRPLFIGDLTHTVRLALNSATRLVPWEYDGNVQ
jgi:AmiR/NasT family two-component response regulator